ncbi:MAG TPA: VWA domain-containing protein [Bryobacteraceae bacterium]|nr:VWA domain-containing protein [Bryobacteraceae bacterium]
MWKAGVVSLLLAACIAPIPSRAQEATPPSGQPTIKVNAAEVSLDVVVRDKKGKQVKNLKPADLEVYEDGVKEDVTSFQMVSGKDLGGAKDKKQAAAPQPSAQSRPLRELNTIAIIFHNIDPVTRPHAIEIVKEFIKSNLPPESYIGIFNLNEKLDVVHEFTKNREELLSSAFNGGGLDFNKASVALLTASPNITTLSVSVNASAHTASATEDTTGGEVSKTTIMGADVNTGAGANRLRGDQVQEARDFAQITGMHETDRIKTLIDQIGTLPGRKTVLLVSTGLSTTGDPDIFQRLVTNANSHGITFYTLDSTEMSADVDTIQGGNNSMAQLAHTSQQQSNLNASISQMKQNSQQGDATMLGVRGSDSQSHLRELAEGTGGFLIANTNDFRKSFQQLDSDLETHYEVLYRPTTVKLDGRFHRIEVKVAHPDYQVETRSGYYAMPELKDSGPMTATENTDLAVLNVTPRPHAFDFHVNAYHFQQDGASPVESVAFELPGNKLGSTADPARKLHKFDISLLALVRNSDGEVVDKYSLEKPYYIPDANLAAARSEGLTYTHKFDLPPGKYTVEAAVVDHEGGQATSQTGSFEIPAPPKGLGISSLAMVEHLDGAGAKPDASDPFLIRDKVVVPMVQPEVGSAKRWIYFVVYKDKASQEKPKLHVEFKNGGQVVADQMAALPEPDKNGAIALLVAAPSRPGNCELKVTAQQGTESASEHIDYVGASQ